MTIILQSFRSVYPKTDLSFRRKEIGAAVLPFRLRRVGGEGVFLQIFCSYGTFDRAKSGFNVSTMGCLHDLPINLTGFRKPVRLKRPLSDDLFGLFTLKQICIFGAKKSVPLFYLSGCAAWWEEACFSTNILYLRNI